MAYRKQTSTDESDYVLVVNEDGSLSVLCTNIRFLVLMLIHNMGIILEAILASNA